MCVEPATREGEFIYLLLGASDFVVSAPALLVLLEAPNTI